MSTLVLDVMFIDNPRIVEKEFNDLTALAVWLHGQRESDINWLTLYDNNVDKNDYVAYGWSEIFQYIKENTEPVQWTVCNDLAINRALIPHDLPQCRDVYAVKVIDDLMALNPFPPSKSSCIALRASELNIEVINHPMAPTPEPGDMSGLPVPVGTVTFGELEDGAEFYLAETYAYGGRQKYQKVLEDGEHNAVWCNDHNTTARIPDKFLVIRA